MADTILVFDLGLTNCKVIVFSASGNILAQSTQAYPTYYPQNGWVEQNPDEWWKAICQGTNQIWQMHPELSAQVGAISVTGHMHALVAVGTAHRTLEQALILGDQRSIQAAERTTADLGLPIIYKITGARMDASMPAAKIRWLQEHAPAIHRDTRLFLGCKDYIRRLLTSDALTDPIDACAMSLYDIHADAWSPDLLKVSGICQDQLPVIASPTQIAGELLDTAAKDLGLRSGIPVVVGGGDDIEVLGNGLMTGRKSLEHLGTTGSILTVSSEPAYDPEMALELYPHAQKGLWVLGGSITTAGAAVVWASKLLGFGDLDHAFSALTTVIAPDAENSLVFLPHLLGERSPSWQPQSRGSWIGLTAKHTANDLMRSAFEGTVYALKHILDRIESLVGVQDLITVSAREYENAPWLRLRANIYERPLALLRSTEPTGLGAMILAAVGIGFFASLQDAVENIAAVDRTLMPETETAPYYRRSYGNYRHALDTLQSYWHP